MPQSNRRVTEYDLRGDMQNYYRHSIATYLDPKLGRVAASVSQFHGDNNELQVSIHLLPPDAKTWSNEPIVVPVEAMDWVMPPLGMVEVNGAWFGLQRIPARRMRKGFHEETIAWMLLEDSDSHPDTHVVDHRVVKQIWYGNPNRISNNVVVWNKGIYYMADKVATIDDRGQVDLIPNKEKLGELVCKALLNNWELATSKYSVRTLPSCVPTPLV